MCANRFVNMYVDYDDDDMESDEDSDDLDIRPHEASMPPGNHYFAQVDKRAHHNALERKRRDHIKDSFSNLQNSVPSLRGEKASRAQILKKSADYLMFMKKKTNETQHYSSNLKRRNALLESEIKALRNAKINGTYPAQILRNLTHESETESSSDSSETESSSDEDDEAITVTQHPSKRFRPEY